MRKQESPKPSPVKKSLWAGIAIALLAAAFLSLLLVQGREVLAAAGQGTFSGQATLALGWKELCSKISGVDFYRIVEAGDPLPGAAAFLRGGDGETAAAYSPGLDVVNLKQPGAYPVTIVRDGNTYAAEILVVDTVPPKAVSVERQCLTVDTLPAESFVEDIADATGVTVTFAAEPDFTRPGTQNVDVVLTDAGGNQTTLSSVLTVMEDTQPPAISGVRDQRFHTGDTVAYKKDVTVADDYDQEVKLVVDSSKVNPTKPGRYEVIYSARDRAGNLATETAVFTFTEATEFTDLMNAETEKVLKRITKDGMSQTEIARAIYKWAKSHIAYSGHSNKGDWEKAAVQGFTKGSGDCYIYFATAKALLEKAGIQNIDVEKIYKEGRSMHYWSLVNCGQGWYHFDTTPRKGGGEFFMLTDKELETYSLAHSNSHEFDHTLYPATPEEQPKE